MAENKMDWLGLGSLGLNAIGSVLGISSQNHAMRKQFEYNKQLQEMAQQYNTSERIAAQNFNKQMLDYTNAYNAPSAQRQRLESAGFNPYMQNVGAGTSAGVTTTPQSVGASSVGLPNIGSVVSSSFDNAARILSERSKVISESNKNNAAASKDNVESDYIKTQDKRMQTLTPLDVLSMQAQVENYKEDSELKREMQNLTTAQTLSAKLGNEYQRIVNKYADEQQKAALNHTLAVIANANEDLKLKPLQRRELISRACKQFAEANNINIQSEIGQQEFRILVNTADSAIASVNMENRLNEISNSNLFNAESVFGRNIAWNYYQAQNYNNQLLKHLSLGRRNYYKQFGPKTANFFNAANEVFGKAAESALPLGMFLIGSKSPQSLPKVKVHYK